MWNDHIHKYHSCFIIIPIEHYSRMFYDYHDCFRPYSFRSNYYYSINYWRANYYFVVQRSNFNRLWWRLWNRPLWNSQMHMHFNQYWHRPLHLCAVFWYHKTFYSYVKLRCLEWIYYTNWHRLSFYLMRAYLIHISSSSKCQSHCQNCCLLVYNLNRFWNNRRASSFLQSAKLLNIVSNFVCNISKLQRIQLCC